MCAEDVLCTDFGGVSSGIHKVVDVGHIGGLHLDNPASAVGVVVNRRCIFESGVELNHFAVNGHQQVGNSLHGLNAAKVLTSGDGLAFGGHVNKNDVAQLVLCVVGDAHVCKFAFNSHPFVICQRIYET